MLKCLLTLTSIDKMEEAGVYVVHVPYLENIWFERVANRLSRDISTWLNEWVTNEKLSCFPLKMIEIWGEITPVV